MRGQKKRPLPVQKGPGRSASEGPCDPLAHKQAVKNPEKEGTNPPRSRRSPGPHSGQGRARSPVAHFGEITYSGLKGVWPQNKQKGGKEHKDKRSTGKPLPPRVPRKRPQKVQGESQKRAGPRMAPREKRQETGRTAKTGKTDKSGGTQTRKKPEKQVRVRGVLLLPDLCLSKKKNKTKTTTTTKKPKEERTNPEKNQT